MNIDLIKRPQRPGQYEYSPDNPVNPHGTDYVGWAVLLKLGYKECFSDQMPAPVLYLELYSRAAL